MTKPLTIYKASAGSGKTFTLATEYIKLLVRDPQAYRKTLAVTFTNKATEEMKMRILSQLYGIWRGLPESKPYLDKVCEKLNASPKFVAAQAGKALKNLLHNYSYFRVETIDSFFQSVLRNLARELDLTANLRIELNDYQVEEIAVDQLIENLKATDIMLQWLLKYIMDTIEENHSWNVISQIKSFGKTIFKDFYKKNSQSLNTIICEKDFFENYTSILRGKRKEVVEHMQNIAESFFDTIEAEGILPEEFAYANQGGLPSFFQKLRQGDLDKVTIGPRIIDAIGNPEKWCKKTSPQKELIYQLADGELGKIVQYAYETFPKQYYIYKSAGLTLRHLSQLRLLDSIEKKVRELNTESNRFLLSDTQKLLNDLIEGSDSPFIFEKIGSQLEHIMIDEFQDTSTVQWQNFKVLLEEAMSHADSENLIVGDVKQSIYRWRSGDWRLLANIKNEFTNADQRLQIETLSTNYRSSTNVINFNNAFFAEAAKTEEVEAYDDIHQDTRKGQQVDGLVSINLLPQKDYQQCMLAALTQQVTVLFQQGAKATDIAILVRTNSLIPLIANYFMDNMPNVKIVSDEAFRLDASPAVRAIIEALRALNHPEDDIARAYLLKVCYPADAMHTILRDKALPAAFTEHMDTLKRMPLYELTEQLYAIFQLENMDGQSAYLCGFFDQVANFVGDNASDINSFLKEWDDSICGKTIQSPEIDGIRLISIHKSKGLEFAHVLIPFCDWRLEQKDVLWCHPEEAPFNMLPIVPIDFSKSGMENTIYYKDYEEEHGQNAVDNLNLLYVAFTRAAHNLFVWGKRKSSNSRSALIEIVLPKIVPLLDGATIDGEQDIEVPLCLTFGHISMPSEEKKTESANPFLTPAEPVDVGIHIYEKKVNFRQSNNSKMFVTAADEDAQQQNNYIQLGNILHNVFSTIKTTEDVDAALKQLELDGVIYDKQITKERVEDLIRKRLKDPRVMTWFNPKANWILYNECTILLPDGQERRPDRVMTNGNETIVVDFKFGHERNEHYDQVREYMHLLQQMNMPVVKGYLWFVYSNIIIEVK